MIAQLTGTIARKDASGVVIVTGDGVGYGLSVPVSTLTNLPAVDETVTVYTHTHVREDALALFGFATQAEQRLFTQLLGVSGIGPKVALAILSISNPDDIRAAISSGDAEFISSVPGIGKKTAERVIIDLQDKIEMVTTGGEPRGNEDVVEALVGLGYSRKEAAAAVMTAAKDGSTDDEILKIALKELAS
jgi:Holliday junction DNA helicase RuvA